MHIEILVEDSSGAKVLDSVVPKLLGSPSNPHSWRIHSYKGVGRVPRGLIANTDPAKRILLDRLPKLLQGYGKTSGIDAVVIVLDADKRNCVQFLGELNDLAKRCNPAPNSMFRLAIEEVEAWYLGDRQALREAFPNLKSGVLNKYVQDSACDTWELLADAVYRGGSTAIKKAGWPLPGQVKHDWAKKIAPLLNPERNESPSFGKLCAGLRRLTADKAE